MVARTCPEQRENVGSERTLGSGEECKDMKVRGDSEKAQGLRTRH